EDGRDGKRKREREGGEGCNGGTSEGGGGGLRGGGEVARGEERRGEERGVRCWGCNECNAKQWKAKGLGGGGSRRDRKDKGM
ncbi:MAG: hypothetical protein M1830_001925, partial [Pleopsidium flavum]